MYIVRPIVVQHQKYFSLLNEMPRRRRKPQVRWMTERNELEIR